MNAQLTYIAPTKLYHHPNNPRRDYKNIDELADSIRAKGILQNLTVVPYDPTIHAGLTVQDPNDAYVVIIGNRRLEGSLKAKIAEVPCIVQTGMSLVDQITVMEVENNLREDTDPSKQAANYQLMLDLGETVESIAKRTGFSQTTIRNRIKLLDLDPEKMAEADQRGGTLADYAQLSKIKDPKLKNEVLAYVGTGNFQAELKRAKDQEKRTEYKQDTVKLLATFAREETGIYPDRSIWNCMETYAWWNKRPITVPQDSAEREYIYYVMGDEVRLFRKRNTDELQAISDAALLKQHHQRIEAELEEASIRAYELRKSFVFSVTSANAKKHFGEITSYAAPVLMRKAETYSNINRKLLAELLSIPYETIQTRCQESQHPDFLLALQKNPEYAMLAMTYSMVDDSGLKFYQMVYDKKQECSIAGHKDNETLKNLYALLVSLGYAMSDEEKGLMDGTSPLFPCNRTAATSAA